jgi:hypothetical protein
VWLEINHIETLLDHMGSAGAIRKVKCSSSFVKGLDLSSPTHGLRSLGEDCTPGKHQEIEVNISWIMYL